jgi:hypothetical protein
MLRKFTIGLSIGLHAPEVQDCGFLLLGFLFLFFGGGLFWYILVSPGIQGLVWLEQYSINL